jgi:predicted transcriptional regulator of viral defense system
LEVPGVLSHATALDLHELCDINPSRIDLTVPTGLHRETLADSDLTWHEGLMIVTEDRAIRGAIELGVG